MTRPAWQRGSQPGCLVVWASMAESAFCRQLLADEGQAGLTTTVDSVGAEARALWERSLSGWRVSSETETEGWRSPDIQAGRSLAVREPG